MSRRTKSAERAARYRERLRQRTAPADLEERVEAVRKTARDDAPVSLVRRYVEYDILLDAEMAGKRRSRVMRDLTDAQLALARELGITPRERRLAGDPEEETLSAAIARSVENARKVMARRWIDLQEEIRLFGNKEGQRPGCTRMIADLRLAAPELFSPEELAPTMTAEALFDRIVSADPLGSRRSADDLGSPVKP